MRSMPNSSVNPSLRVSEYVRNTRAKPHVNRVIKRKYLVASSDASREKEHPVSGRSSPISLQSSTNSPACLTTRSASASGSSSGSSWRRLALSILALARGSEYSAMSTRALSRSCVPSVKETTAASMKVNTRVGKCFFFQ